MSASDVACILSAQYYYVLHASRAVVDLERQVIQNCLYGRRLCMKDDVAVEIILILLCDYVEKWTYYCCLQSVGDKCL